MSWVCRQAQRLGKKVGDIGRRVGTGRRSGSRARSAPARQFPKAPRMPPAEARGFPHSIPSCEALQSPGSPEAVPDGRAPGRAPGAAPGSALVRPSRCQMDPKAPVASSPRRCPRPSSPRPCPRHCPRPVRPSTRLQPVGSAMTAFDPRLGFESSSCRSLSRTTNWLQGRVGVDRSRQHSLPRTH